MLSKKGIKSEVKVRFAPSPTGPLHIGAARTALFNWLFAKKNKGKFILRIEDTDISRYKKEYEKDILKALKWLGLNWDKGPYYQSRRKEIYKKYIKKLLKEGKAFWCYHTKEELEAEKKEQMKKGEAPRHICEHKLNSQKSEVKSAIKNSKLKGIIRFNTPIKKIKFTDVIRGEIEFDTSLLGDFSIAKDLNNPLYNLTCVIDDYEMKINYVIRGEDHIPNTPKQILIQEALGFPTPYYAHLPLILGPDRSKLSKRHNAMPINEYKRLGYLPEALINFMAFLGWNPKNEREFFMLDDLIKEFSLESIGKSGAIFNIQKLDYLNGYYIRHTDLNKLTKMCIPYLEKAKLIKKIKDSKFKILETNEIIDFNYIKKIVKLEQERIKKLNEIKELTEFFFKKKLKYKPELLKWKNISLIEVKRNLEILEREILKIKKNEFNEKKLKDILMPLTEKYGRGEILWPFRVALSGKKASPGPFEIAEILGKEKVLERIREAKKLCEVSS